MYIYCVVCYHVIVAPYLRSVGHVFAYLHIDDNDSERPMDYETSLLPEVIHLRTFIQETTVRLNVCPPYHNVHEQTLMVLFV